MAWVTCSVRSMMLANRKHDLNFKLLQISQRLMDLQTYGSNISDGVLSQSEMASSPSSFFGRQSAYLSRSSAIAYQSAGIKTNDYLQRIGAINQGTQGQYTLASEGEGANVQPYLIFNQIYKAELEEFSKQEQAKINREEKKLTQEKLQIETQLKAADAEYENVQKAMEDDIKKSAIKLV